MDYRRIGKSGLKVSVLGFGNWLTHGGGIDDDVARACVRKAWDLGINFFDTADIYRKGAAEEFLGPQLRAFRRQDIVLATKVFWPMSDNVNDRGLSRKHIHEGVENSLRRLQVDYIDLYQCHRHDPDTEVYEVVRAMDDLIRRGKILYWGVSEWPALEIKNACAVARELHADPPISEQPEYSLAARRVETNGVQRACLQEGMGMLVWSPLKQGLLTGKYSGGKVPAGSRAGNAQMNMFLTQIDREIVDRADRLRPIALAHDATLAQLALAWVISRPAVSSAILGASRPEQVEENVAALNVKLTDADLAQMDELFSADRFR